jgi:hypothetical protein
MQLCIATFKVREKRKIPARSRDEMVPDCAIRSKAVNSLVPLSKRETLFLLRDSGVETVEALMIN